MKAIPQIFILFISVITPLYASDVGYEVEIIIFEDLNKSYLHTENWSENTVMSATPSENSLNNDQEENKPNSIKTDNQDIFEFTTRDSYKLSDYETRLSSSSNYRVLYHSAWKQAGLDRDNAISLKIDSSLLKDETEVSSLPNSVDNAELTHNSFIKGSVTLILSRYLHFETDLVLYLKNNNNQLPLNTDYTKPILQQAEYSEYHIKSERRMRSREIHYIDHPLIGILVTATPYKISDTTSNEQPELPRKL